MKEGYILRMGIIYIHISMYSMCSLHISWGSPPSKKRKHVLKALAYAYFCNPCKFYAILRVFYGYFTGIFGYFYPCYYYFFTQFCKKVLDTIPLMVLYWYHQNDKTVLIELLQSRNGNKKY